MNNKDHAYKELLKKFVEGTLDEEEKNVLMQAVEKGEVDEIISYGLDQEWQKSSAAESGKVPMVLFESLPIPGIIKEEEKKAKVVSIFSKTLIRFAIAASLSGIILFTGWKSGLFNFGAGVFRPIPDGYVQVEHSGEGFVEFMLPDDSQVSLAKGAVLHYPESFTGNVREVYLSGSAFFRVKHMSDKRFVVKADKISAEVLGTSFWVHQDEQSGVSDVEVRTGKVKVTASVIDDEQPNHEMIVLPNQRAILSSGTTALKLALADSILPLSDILKGQTDTDLPSIVPSFQYKKATLLTDILSDFEKVYGVSFKLNNDQINNCLVSGDFSGQDFFKNLEIICLIIGAEYAIEGTTILISGPGCAN